MQRHGLVTAGVLLSSSLVALACQLAIAVNSDVGFAHNKYPITMPPSSAPGPQSNRGPECQNQSMLVNLNGSLCVAAIRRGTFTLPFEILAKIFVDCLPEVDFATPNPTIAPLLLCGVCHRWREVALATPMLWSSLAFDAVHLATEDESTVDLYRRWLSRAKKSPLSLSFQEKEDTWTALRSRLFLRSPGTGCKLLEDVALLSLQWQKLELDIKIAEFFLSSKRVLEVDFSSLERLIILAGPYATLDLPISLCAGPRLHEIFIPAYRMVQPTQIPWAQLTTFHTGHISLPSCFEVLSNASNLVNGAFDIDHHPRLPVVPLPNLSSAHLQSLEVTGMTVDSADQKSMSILNFLTMPALKNLTLQFTRPSESSQRNAWNRSHVSPLLSFISRSSLQLHSLALSRAPVTTDTLIACLNALPSLVHLKLEPLRSVKMDAVFVGLTGNRLLPNLESLHMFFSAQTGVHSIDAFTLIRMLRWRWSAVGVTRLRSFQMAYSQFRLPFWNEKANTEFRRLEEEGMDLYLGEKRPRLDSLANSLSLY
ncbi:hypothetical protein DFH06DRAFT_48825 [Mycena polygramma]|nr:hypothetical protein DFH06DRAFT_48825 [Mycena polygramma]